MDCGGNPAPDHALVFFTTICESLRRLRKFVGARVCDPQQLRLKPGFDNCHASFVVTVQRLTEPRSFGCGSAALG
jgi:hypothetical protein